MKLNKQVEAMINDNFVDNTSYAKTFDLGFINDSGMHDETEFDNVTSASELKKLWLDFCQENRFEINNLIYIERK